ncbi:MAG: DUF1905 domain-containing protein [Merdibacter sp.]
MNPKIYEFDAVIRKVEGLEGHILNFPGMCGLNSAAAAHPGFAEFDGIPTRQFGADGHARTFSASARISARRSANNPAIRCVRLWERAIEKSVILFEKHDKGAQV